MPMARQSEILSMVDILKTDAVEAEFLTGKGHIQAPNAWQSSGLPKWSDS